MLYLASPVSAYAENAGSIDIELSRGSDSVNEAFSVSGMLPGDEEAIETYVTVSHSGGLSMRFQVELTECSAPLSQVLELSVVNSATGAIVCEGTVDELVDAGGIAVDIPPTESGTSVLAWRIKAKLPSSAHSGYPHARCVIDLHWYVQGDDRAKLNPLAKTGDFLGPFALSAVLVVVLASVFLRRRTKREAQEIGGAHASSTAALPAESFAQHAPSTQSALHDKGKPVLCGLAVAALIAAALAWASFWAHARLPQNIFETGSVSIDLNDGDPVFPGDETYIEPGSTLVRNFTVANVGSADAYYRLYLDDLKGSLAASVEIAISQGDALLFQGSAVELEREDACVSNALLAPGETVTLTATVRLAEDTGATGKEQSVEFDLCAQAVQAKNNVGREFS